MECRIDFLEDLTVERRQWQPSYAKDSGFVDCLEMVIVDQGTRVQATSITPTKKSSSLFPVLDGLVHLFTQFYLHEASHTLWSATYQGLQLQGRRSLHQCLTSSDPFFSDLMIKDYYRAYVKAILSRKNSSKGVKYSKDPSIFAWELINEPQCESISSPPARQTCIQTCVAEMAAFAKSLDQKHLIMFGLRGFYFSNSSFDQKYLNVAFGGCWQLCKQISSEESYTSST